MPVGSFNEKNLFTVTHTWLVYYQFFLLFSSFQSRMPFVRTMSMEQRWQDLANLLSLPSPDGGGIHHPFSHHHHHLHNYTHHPHPHSMGYSPEAARGVLLHNATLPTPIGDLNSSVPYSNLGESNYFHLLDTL